MHQKSLNHQIIMALNMIISDLLLLESTLCFVYLWITWENEKFCEAFGKAKYIASNFGGQVINSDQNWSWLITVKMEPFCIVFEE